MASKVHTDNPKHHAYVSVNKRERKKVKRLGAKRPLLTILAREVLELLDRISCSWGWRERGPVFPKNTRIIWNNCNHTSFRIIRKVNGSWNYWTVKRYERKDPYSF